MRRRRALYRATHRGSKELDFLLGRFAEQRIEAMTDIEISVMERLIEIPDPDIALSLFEGNSLGAARPRRSDAAFALLPRDRARPHQKLLTTVHGRNVDT